MKPSQALRGALVAWSLAWCGLARAEEPDAQVPPAEAPAEAKPPEPAPSELTPAEEAPKRARGRHHVVETIRKPGGRQGKPRGSLKPIADDERRKPADVERPAHEELPSGDPETKQAPLDALPDADPLPAEEPLPQLEPAIGEFIETLPESVQSTATAVAQQMTASRAPPDRFLYTLWGLPRSRIGTGTSWLPDESPLLAAVPHFGKWGLLMHGTVYTGYDWYSGKRGGKRFMGRNTLMASLFRTFEKSEWLFRAALSLEPLTIGDRGYPQVLQSGQQADGDRIADKMYALDFFRELAAMYTWEITPKWAGMFYTALAGEPAVGPVTFTQRFSASPDPLAPIGFVAQEASHASFGVLTIGAFTRDMKFEVSWFNGQLPGDHKYTIAIRRPDSYAARFSWNPWKRLSTQVSYAYLGHVSDKDTGRSDHRVSVSGSYTRWHADDSGLAATLAFAEHASNRGDINTALMLEAYWNIEGHHAIYGRGELLQKNGKELMIPEPTTELFAIGAISAGYIYYIGRFITLTPGIGIRGSINLMENDLARFYGGQASYGLMVYAHLRTAALPIGS